MFMKYKKSILAVALAVLISACTGQSNQTAQDVRTVQEPASQDAAVPVPDQTSLNPGREVYQLNGKPSTAECGTALAAWFSDSLKLGDFEPAETKGGCEMTFDVIGGSYEEIRSKMSAALIQQGYKLKSEVQASRGERLTFAKNGFEVSILLRSRKAVKVEAPDAEARANVHWYQRAAMKAN